jgi:hypothetical protein
MSGQAAPKHRPIDSGADWGELPCCATHSDAHPLIQRGPVPLPLPTTREKGAARLQEVGAAQPCFPRQYRLRFRGRPATRRASIGEMVRHPKVRAQLNSRAILPATLLDQEPQRGPRRFSPGRSEAPP